MRLRSPWAVTAESSQVSSVCSGTSYWRIAPMKLPRCLRPVGWIPLKMIGFDMRAAAYSGGLGLRRLAGALAFGAVGVAAVAALAGLGRAAACDRLPLAFRVLDPEAGDDAAEDHQDPGDPDPEAEARGRGVLGGLHNPVS